MLYLCMSKLLLTITPRNSHAISLNIEVCLILATSIAQLGVTSVGLGIKTTPSKPVSNCLPHLFIKFSQESCVMDVVNVVSVVLVHLKVYIKSECWHVLK